MQEYNKITRKQAYESMIHLLLKYYKTTGSTDITDILSGGEYSENTDEPRDKMFKHWWNEIVEDVEKGLQPKRMKRIKTVINPRKNLNVKNDNNTEEKEE
jgi:hypothetical protein